ncbi:hypothetical protein B9Q01_10725 [Candidatus Marsarchaeota G1 archaeon OSP_D]|uniref:Uncharacterized protein n=1 Tax=Candidatus Marsarchaeota G1 archaeon OSP_D TaxID=1978155 RepID=A0A2R6A5V7_9ARCH|nr:MAG: hypothetical protein B9Q01_10725 [Candidatus Marsarchaeota G1 archaeon OSP_D]
MENQSKVKEEFTNQTMTKEEWERTVEKVANDTYQKFLAMGLRTVIKVTPQYALIGFRIADLAKAIQERSENKVIVQAKAKELGLWITILPNKNNNKQQ